MAFKTKVQLIERKKSEQWYINFPSALAQAMDFEKSEGVEWSIHDRETLVLRRPNAPESVLKKNALNNRRVNKYIREAVRLCY